MAVVALDFDGVLNDFHHPLPGKRFGAPLPGAREACELLVEAGHELVIYSCKSGSARGIEAIADWLDWWQFDPIRISQSKPNADVYVDDRGYHFTSWDATLAHINNHFGSASE